MLTRYRAPGADRAVLADPPRGDWPRLADENRRRLNAEAVKVGGAPLGELRQAARREVLGLAAEYLKGEVPSPPPAGGGLSPDAPLVLAGHQPELSHPGVWVKHFALNGLAKQLGGVSLNLVADTDTLKSTSLRLPTWDRFEPGRVHLQSVPFDTFEAEAPYETREPHDPELFRTFADRAAPLWANWGYEPLLPQVWPRVVRCPDTIGGRFARVRRSYEREWGCHNLELPVSRLARTDAFRRFATHILADRERFRAVYNAAVGEYRQAHGIRSANHPVPDLAPGETPFWGGPDPAGRRTRTVTRVDDQTRPRALTLTLFCRLCLGDFFVHGIGGGKYDEVTDALIRDYFGIEPPRYGVLSATLHLPLPTFPATADTVRHLHRRERDLRWNPQRHGAGGPAADRKAALIRAEPTGRAERREWFRQLRDATERLQPFVTKEYEGVGEELREASQETAANALLRRRDFAWVLFPEGVLRPFLQGFL
ncbi:MAG: hypothetical protein U0871_16540 [Gemmataceae bacterium]